MVTAQAAPGQLGLVSWATGDPELQAGGQGPRLCRLLHYLESPPQRNLWPQTTSMRPNYNQKDLVGTS